MRPNSTGKGRGSLSLAPIGRMTRLPPLLAILLAAGAVAACGISSGTQYNVGDCLKTEVNENGEAFKVDCSDPDSFTVKKLARNGGRPHVAITCPEALPISPMR
jgi:hypothetical protein